MSVAELPQLQSARTFVQRPRPQWLIEGMVQREGLILITAKSGVFKTVFTQGLLWAIADDSVKNVYGNNVLDHGYVVHVVTEGQGAVANQLDALATYYKRDYPDTLLLYDDAIDLSNAKQINLVRTQLDALPDKPLMIVLDTWGDCNPDLDENSRTGVKKTIDVARRIQERYNCVVALIHHDTKSGSLASGHNELQKPQTTIIQLRAGKNKEQSVDDDDDESQESNGPIRTITVRCHKMRGESMFPNFTLNVRRVHLGNERYSIVLESKTAGGTDLTPKQFTILSTIATLNGTSTIRAIIETVGGTYTRDDINNALRRLRTLGLADRSADGHFHCTTKGLNIINPNLPV